MSNSAPQQSRDRLFGTLVQKLQRLGNLKREDIQPALATIQYIFQILGKPPEDENLDLSNVCDEFKEYLLGYLDHIVKVNNSGGDVKAYLKLFNLEPSDKAILYLKALLNSLQKPGNSWFGVYLQSFYPTRVKELPVRSNEVVSSTFLGTATQLVENYRGQISTFREIVLNIYTLSPELKKTIAQFAVSRDYSSQNPGEQLLEFSDELRFRISDLQELFKIITDLFFRTALREIIGDGITLINLEQLLEKFSSELPAELVTIIDIFEQTVPGSATFLKDYFSSTIKIIRAIYAQIKRKPAQAMVLFTTVIGKLVTVQLNPQDFIQLSSDVSTANKIPLTKLGGSSKIIINGYVLPDKHNLHFALSLVDRSQDPQTWLRLAIALKHVERYRSLMQGRGVETAHSLLEAHKAKYPYNDADLKLIENINTDSKPLRERIVSLRILTGQILITSTRQHAPSGTAIEQIKSELEKKVLSELLQIITDLKNFSLISDYTPPKHIQIALGEIWREFIQLLNKITPFLANDQLKSIVDALKDCQSFVLSIRKEDGKILFKAPAHTNYDLQRKLGIVRYKQALLSTAVAKHSHISGEDTPHTTPLLLREYKHSRLANVKGIEKEVAQIESLSEFLVILQNPEGIVDRLDIRELIPLLLANLRILKRRFTKDFPPQFFTTIAGFLALELDNTTLRSLVLYIKANREKIDAVANKIPTELALYAAKKSQIELQLQTDKNLSDFIKEEWDAQLLPMPNSLVLPNFANVFEHFSRLQNSVRYDVTCSISSESPQQLIRGIETYIPGSFKREEGKALSPIKYRFNGGDIKITRSSPGTKDGIMQALKGFIPFLKIILPFFKNKTFSITLCLDLFNILYSKELSRLYREEKEKIEESINESKEARELFKRIAQRTRLNLNYETALERVEKAPAQLLTRLQGLGLAFPASEQ